MFLCFCVLNFATLEFIPPLCGPVTQNNRSQLCSQPEYTYYKLTEIIHTYTGHFDASCASLHGDDSVELERYGSRATNELGINFYEAIAVVAISKGKLPSVYS